MAVVCLGSPIHDPDRQKELKIFIGSANHDTGDNLEAPPKKKAADP